MTLQIGHLAGPVDLIPPSPPREVLDALGAAAARAEALAAAGRRLHFAGDPDTGRVIVQVRDQEGNVVRTIGPSEALDIMSGLAEA